MACAWSCCGGGANNLPVEMDDNSPLAKMNMMPTMRKMPRRLLRKVNAAVLAGLNAEAQENIKAARLAPAKKTELAIAAEVARKEMLTPEERAQIGRSFTDPESIFSMLEIEGGEATVLLRASWVRGLRNATDRWPKRGDKLPKGAIISPAELRQIYEKANGRTSLGKQRLLPFIALSHFWRQQGNPDPDGVTLQLVVSALNARWDEFGRCGVTDLGIFYDYSSLYQVPRDEAQARIFKQSLKGINLWYGHQLTTVWLVTGGDVTRGGGGGGGSGGGGVLGYHQRGWTSFEYALSMMIAASNASVKTDWPQVVDLGRGGSLGDQVDFQRPAPAEPLAFFSKHSFGQKRYTNGADRDNIVAPIFRRTIFELLGGVRVLNFNRLGWTCAEAEQLAVVLPLCGSLRKLELVHNRIRDRGVEALAAAMARHGSLTQLREVNFSYNEFGDNGCSALAAVVERATALLPALKVLRLPLRNQRLKDQCRSQGIDIIVEGSQRNQVARPSESADANEEGSVFATKATLYKAPSGEDASVLNDGTARLRAGSAAAETRAETRVQFV